jgi:hypothetical protein
VKELLTTKTRKEDVFDDDSMLFNSLDATADNSD